MQALKCPKCNADFSEFGELTLYGYVDAKDDPQGKARLDIIFECENCEQGWNVFVPVDEFFANPIEECL